MMKVTYLELESFQRMSLSWIIYRGPNFPFSLRNLPVFVPGQLQEQPGQLCWRLPWPCWHSAKDTPTNWSFLFLFSNPYVYFTSRFTLPIWIKKICYISPWKNNGLSFVFLVVGRNEYFIKIIAMTLRHLNICLVLNMDPILRLHLLPSTCVWFEN